MARASGTVRQLRAACSPLGLAALAVVAAVQWCVGGAGVLPVAWAWSDSVDTAAEAEREAAFLALKAEKEAFVSGHNGAPMWEVSLVVSSFPAGLLLHRVLYAFLEERGGRTAPSTWPAFASFLLEFGCLVMPLVVCFTAAELAPYVVFGLVGTAFYLTHLARRLAAGSGASRGRDAFDIVVPTTSKGAEPTLAALASARKPYITNYRSAMILSTCVAILAVDFTVFPRRFCKAEVEGTGLMDVGVGAFVFAAAIVSPQARVGSGEGSGEAPSPRLPPVPSRLQVLVKSARASSPMLLIGVVLGFMRLFVTKALRYQEHATEYGVHWNFFFTLAAVALMSAALEVAIPSFGALNAATGSEGSWHFLAAGLVLVAGYEVALLTGLKDYILHAPRVDLLSANREGICGCVGFLAIFFCGVWVGRHVNATRHTVADWRTLLRDLAAACVVLWVATLLMDAYLDRVSRRLTNGTYVMWTLAYSVTQLLVLVSLDLSWRSHRFAKVPSRILEGTNKNGLAMFMIANLGTGAVNLSMTTIHAPNAVGYAVVTVYMLWVSGIAAALENFGISLKFW